MNRDGAKPVTCGNAELSQIWCPMRAPIPPPYPRLPLLSGSPHSRSPGRSVMADRCSCHLCRGYAGTADTVPCLPRTCPSNPARDLPARRGQPVAVAASSAQDDPAQSITECDRITPASALSANCGVPRLPGLHQLASPCVRKRQLAGVCGPASGSLTQEPARDSRVIANTMTQVTKPTISPLRRSARSASGQTAIAPAADGKHQRDLSVSGSPGEQRELRAGLPAVPRGVEGEHAIRAAVRHGGGMWTPVAVVSHVR